MGFDISLFTLNLKYTVMWCSKYFSTVDLKSCLRTPPIPIDYLYPNLEVIGTFGLDVLHKKSQVQNNVSTNNLLEGRLLVTFLYLSSCDGTSSVETLGFIDDCDLPAWDTWVYFEKEENIYNTRWEKSQNVSYLVSWIPVCLHSLVNIAIEVNAVKSIQWIEEIDFQISIFQILQNYNFFRGSLDMLF